MVDELEIAFDLNRRRDKMMQVDGLIVAQR